MLQLIILYTDGSVNYLERFFCIYGLLLLLFFIFYFFVQNLQKMADAEDIQPLVCDNGTGMVKVG